MDNLETEFPTVKTSYLKASDFQDIEMSLTFKGFARKANEDDPPTKKNPQKWKQKVKYMLRYSYPEWAVDEVGEKRLDNEGNPFKNKYWLPEYPHGYSIVYSFEEGELESGSLPLFEAFCRVRPTVGDVLIINRTGVDKETKWSVRKDKKVKSIDMDDTEDLEPSDEVPF